MLEVGTVSSSPSDQFILTLALSVSAWSGALLSCRCADRFREFRDPQARPLVSPELRRNHASMIQGV
jgi:hypothetical protein